MKKVVAFLLSVLLMLSALPPVMAERTGEVPEDELERAIWYGFVPENLQGDYDKAITAAEYCTVIAPMIEFYDASKSDAWRRVSVLARQASEEITRDQGMLILFRAALAMDAAELDGDRMDENEQMRDKMPEPWDDFSWSYRWFPDWEQVAPDPWSVFQGNYATTAYAFSFLKLSGVSGQTFFNYDEASNSMRVADPLTRREAILSVVRLYESTEIGVKTWWNLVTGAGEAPEASAAPEPTATEGADTGSLLASTAASAPQPEQDPVVSGELDDALALGLDDKISGDQMTYQSYMAMLDRLVEKIDPNLLATWQTRYPRAREMTEPITRGVGAYLTFCAAEVLGQRYCEFADPDWGQMNEKMGTDIWDAYIIDWDLFADASETPMYAGKAEGFNRYVSAYFLSFAQYSRKTDNRLFDYDEPSNTMRFDAPFTQREALLAAVRLYDAVYVPGPSEDQQPEIEVARALGIVPDGMVLTGNCTAGELIALLQNAVKAKKEKVGKHQWGAGFPIPSGDAEIDRAWATRLLYEGYRLMFGLGADCTEDAFVYTPGRDDRNAFSPIDNLRYWSWNVTADQSRYDQMLKDREKGFLQPGNAFAGAIKDLITFVMCQQDRTNGARVMELTEDRCFRPLDPLTRAEAILAVKRLFCSEGDVSAAASAYQAQGGTLYSWPQGEVRYDNMRLYEDRFHKGQAGVVDQAALEQELAQAMLANPEAKFALPDQAEPEDELERALAQDFIPDALREGGDQIVTMKEYYTLLGNLLRRYGESYQVEWESIAAPALQSDRQMRREDAMMAVYRAACVLGIGAQPHGDWLFVNYLPDGIKNFDYTWNYPDFPEWLGSSPFVGTADATNYALASVHFAQGQHSGKNGQLVFGSESDAMMFEPKQPLTRKDACITALRFSESIGEVADKNTALAIAYQADVRRESILNSKTEIVQAEVYTPGETYTGTAYYVSNTGNDKNDGRSPEKAWATVAKVNKAKLKPGDAVFFERGGLWRGNMLVTQKDVTYSAYGEGQKPRFYGSPENGAEESKWRLFYDENGVKIWEYHRKMADTGGIIFNEGESWANREYGWWNGKGYVRLHAPLEPFDVTKCLDDDLDFATMIDYSGSRFPFDPPSLNRSGALYLRCDRGNPGSLYQSIEFETTDVKGWLPIIHCVETCVVDNLSVRYYANAGISNGNKQSAADVIIQNCEIGWGGNRTHGYEQSTPTKEYLMSGDGIYGMYDGGMIRNNYCHDVDGGGITFETFRGVELLQGGGNYHAEGNLVERCGQGIWLHGRVEGFDPVYVENNMVLYTGYGYNHGCLCVEVGISVGELPEKGRVDGLHVNNNIVYVSRGVLFSTFAYPEGNLHLKGNRYFFK